ncbi:hypothetical protein [Paenibacillus sp. y28]|uniref:hypothetical protein n=1 Tax=Paenibacillus sp. y28 TaxID=3129110 RepID=UPI00301A68D6
MMVKLQQVHSFASRPDKQSGFSCEAWYEPDTSPVIQVLDPEGQPASAARVTLYCREQAKPGEAAVSPSYRLIGSEETDRSGRVHVSGGLPLNLADIMVVVQGVFHPLFTAESCPFVYRSPFQGSGLLTLHGAGAVPVKLGCTDNRGELLAAATYYATVTDDQGAAIAPGLVLSEMGQSGITAYLEPGAYHLFAYSRAESGTYFQAKWSVPINGACAQTFDGRTAGKVTLAADTAADGILNGRMYLYNQGTEQTLGRSGEVLVGRELYVSAGEYSCWMDVEVKDPEGGENWIYIFENTADRITVQADASCEVKAGKKLSLDYYKPDHALLETYVKKLGIRYVPEEDPTCVNKAYGVFYTKQRFVDAYGNALVGMYRGSIAPGAAKPSKRGYYFGNLHANFMVTRLSDGRVVYNSRDKGDLPGLRQFFRLAFWSVARPVVRPDKYRLDLTLDHNPLAGGPIEASILNTVYAAPSPDLVREQAAGRCALTSETVGSLNAAMTGS